MKSLYILLDFLTIIFPVLLSFDKKVAFYKSWKHVFLALLIIGIPFILWDVIFTAMGVWWFNDQYLIGLSIFNLPIEEILFFLVVPFSCTFIYQCLKDYFPKVKLLGFNRLIYALVVIYALFVMIMGWGGAYSIVVGMITLLTVYFLQKKERELKHLPLAFIVSLLPFFIVNGVLTGSGIEQPIVYYNDLENAGKRLVTIPIEDVIYAFILIGGNIATYEWLVRKQIKNS